MALWIGLPVPRSQTMVVSRWLVMPIAAISPGESFARLSAVRIDQITESQMSSGSCSTQPLRGKCCLNSFCPWPTTPMSLPKTMARLDVVP